MPAFFDDTVVLDALLGGIDNATALHICKGAAPASYAAATGTNSMATATLTSGDFTAPANHATSGRQITVAAKSGVTVNANAGAGAQPTYYCLVITASTTLVAYTEVDSGSPALTSGSTVNIPAVTFSVADPTVV